MFRLLKSNHRATAAAVPALALALLAPQAGAQDTPDVVWDQVLHAAQVRSVAFVGDGGALLSGGGTTVRLSQVTDGDEISTVGPTPADLLSAAISPDGALVAAGWIEGTWPPGGVMGLYDVAANEQIRSHGGSYVAFSPLGGVVASAGGGVNRYVTLHDTGNGDELGSLNNGPGYITSLAFAPDGQTLAVGCTDNTVKIWDLGAMIQVDEYAGFAEDVNAVAFSPDGALLAAGEGGFDVDDDARIRIFRCDDGAEVAAWEAHGDVTRALAFGPQGAILVSAGRDGITPLASSIRFWDAADGTLRREYDELALSVDVSPDGSRLAFGGIGGRVVVLAETIFDQTTAAPVPLAVATLHAPRPNPFNPLTELRFELPAAQPVRLTVHDAAGRRLAVLVAGHRAAGEHRVAWDGRDARGRGLPSGVYLMRLETLAGVEGRKVSLVR